MSATPEDSRRVAPQDVRMRGFTSRASVQDAWDWLAARTRRCFSGQSVSENAEEDSRSAEAVFPAESIPTGQAAGRVLAEAITSQLDVPAFDRAAMDGYAVIAAETQGAGDYAPVRLQVVGESLPARATDVTVQAGQAVRIMTGAPLPSGADAVVPAEYADERDGMVELTTSVPTDKHIGRRGEDVSSGSQLLAAGHRLRPQDCAILASVGLGTLRVVRAPRVRLIITGNELALPGGPRGEHQIYEANSSMLTGLITRDGGQLQDIQRLDDDRNRIEQALRAPDVDMILVSGGTSVGQEDHAPLLIAEHGELAIHGIAMRPSSPAGLGTISLQPAKNRVSSPAQTALVFLLPGNPVSCLCAYDFFAGRALRALAGRPAEWPYRSEPGTLRRKIVSAIGREDYCRVQVSAEGVTPLALSGASILSSTVRANGFVVVPANCEGSAPGETVDVLRYDSLIW